MFGHFKSIEESDVSIAKSVDCRALIGEHIPLSGRGANRVGLCPFHSEKTPSFNVYKNGYHCFGCGESGDSISWIMKYLQVSFVGAVDILGGEPVRYPAVDMIHPKPSGPLLRDPFACGDVDRVSEVRGIWSGCVVGIRGTAVSSFLSKRGISVRSESIRVGVDDRGVFMAAGIFSGGHLTAIQRTWIDLDTYDRVGKRLSLGPIRSGACPLHQPIECLGLAEGVEKALAAYQIYKIPTWAAIGTRMDRVAIPDGVRRIVIFRDNDEPGQAAAIKAEHKFIMDGLAVAIASPPEQFKDFDEWTKAMKDGDVGNAIALS